MSKYTFHSMRTSNILQTKIICQVLCRYKSLFECLAGVLCVPKTKLMFISEWREFPSALCLAGKKNLMTARVSMLLKSRASLTCFRACFLPGRATDLSAPRGIFHYYTIMSKTVISVKHVQQVNSVLHKSEQPTRKMYFLSCTPNP